MIIEISDLAFSYESQTILENVNVTVKEGEYLAIVGPNGGGKTTLIKIILGLLKPYTGDVSLFGIPAGKFNDRHLIGYVPQRISSIERFFPANVGEVVMTGLTGKIGMLKRVRKEYFEAVDKVLEIAGIWDLKKKLIGELSGGQRQKVFIARAMVSEPKLLIFDEPSTGVDIASQEQFYLFLRKINKENGITIVFVSHDIDVISKEASQILCLNKTVVCCGPPKMLLGSDYLEKLYGGHVGFVGHHHK